MKDDAKRARAGRFWLWLWRYTVFFLLIAFVVTCCMTLFLKTLQSSMGILWEREMIAPAARITFANVLLVSLLCTAIDITRRWYMVERPVRRITAAAERLMQGDLSARIPPQHSIDPQDGFAAIAEAFNRMAQELSGTETLRADFIANVSHELKTPLAVMQNYATLLRQPNLPDARRAEYAQAVAAACRRLTALVTNILKLNKLENQQIYPEAKRYNVSEQLCAELLAFEPVWEEKQIEVETALEEDVWVEADAELLSLVWSNLLSNAFKFTPQGGCVRVSLTAEDGCAAVRVADTGCGISRGAGAHIFEKFYQGDASHAAQGNGLGLALVKRVVEIVGGEISVSSTPGKGSTFTVTLGRASREAG